MCLAIPGRVLDLTHEDGVFVGRVAFGEMARRVCLKHVPEEKPGDHVLVHVGFALSRIDEAEAKRVFAYLEELDQLGELAAPAPEEPAP